jgi:hypothetical protein
MFNAQARRDREQSNAVLEMKVEISPEMTAAAGRIRRALAARDPSLVMAASLAFVDALCDSAKVPRVPLRIIPQRKRSGRAGFHGGCGPKFITVYLRAARAGRFITFRTFVKTVCHEVCHHYDWKVLGLANSLHTKGFARRVDILCRHVLESLEPAGPA